MGEAVGEALRAFDAANHAFGRFVTYVVRPQNQPVPPAVQHVRAALQEAAISVPSGPDPAALGEWLLALQEAQARLADFLHTPPPGYPLGEAFPAEEALAEAVAMLTACVREA